MTEIENDTRFGVASAPPFVGWRWSAHGWQAVCSGHSPVEVRRLLRQRYGDLAEVRIEPLGTVPTDPPRHLSYRLPRWRR